MRARELEEKWSEKYKRSINCNNPKGFSQRAHCAGRKKNEDVAEDENQCPPATQDIKLNLDNRQKAIDDYGYGPLNPDLPNTKFWMKKVDEWNLDSVDEAKQSLCGNCAAFDQRQKTLDCIAQGIDKDNPADAEATINAGDLGYCKFLKFKCASRRTCDAWVTGGPITDKEQGVEEHIVKVKGGYELKSKHGNKNLGKYPTRAGAEKRERQVQYFKHVNESVDREELKTLHSAMADLLPIVMKELGLKNLPKIKIVRELNNDGQPSFGCFSNEGITLAITGRHPVDICRTLAHELVHYKQKLDDKLNPDSGETGSSEENEANSVAGIIMRKFSQEFPAYINNEV